MKCPCPSSSACPWVRTCAVIGRAVISDPDHAPQAVISDPDHAPQAVISDPDPDHASSSILHGHVYYFKSRDDRSPFFQLHGAMFTISTAGMTGHANSRSPLYITKGRVQRRARFHGPASVIFVHKPGNGRNRCRLVTGIPEIPTP